MPASRSLATLFAAASSLIWGFTFLSIKVSISVLPPMTLGLARFAIASVLLAFLLLIRRRPPALKAGDLPRMAASGLMGVTVYFLCENNGILLLSASEASLVIATIPVLTLLADRIFLRARLTWRNYTGAALSIAGVGLIVLESLRFSSSPLGYLFMLLAALAWVGYGFLTQPLFKVYDRLEITFWQGFFGMLGFLPFVLFETTAWADLNLVIALNVLYLGVFGSALATLFYVGALAVLGASTVNVYINLIPVISVAASFFILGERLAPLQFLGGAVAVGGVWLATSLGKSSAPRLRGRPSQ